MKTIHLALVFMGTVVLAAGCGGGGSSSSSPATPVGTVQITNTNAPAVAKGGMTPSQTAAKTGSGGAAVVGVVVQPSAPGKSVMDVALAQIKRVQGIKVPAASAGVVGASVAPFPVSVDCTNFQSATPGAANTMTIDVQGTSTNGIFTSGNVATISYFACVEAGVAGATTTTNGSMSLTIGSVSGTGTAASSLNESVTVSFTNFSVVDAAPGTVSNTLTMSGGMTMAITDNGTTMTATMSGTSFAMTSTTDGSFTMKNFSIVLTDDSPAAATPTGNYSFSISMTTTMANTTAGVSGDIGITTPTVFTGTGAGNPTAGVMVISGAGGSSVTLTANANGTVTMVVNDGTNPTTTSTVTWADI